MKTNNQKAMVLACALAIVLTLVRTPGFAFTPGACRQDAEKLCPGASDKDAVPCLKEHQADLSTPCKVNLAEAREHVRQMKEECESDKKKFCADVQEGKGRILQCLKAHEADLSKACRDKIADAKRKMFPDSADQK